MNNKLNYTHSRLEIGGVATVYVAVNEVTSAVEQLTPIVILDNEIDKTETRIPLGAKEFKVLKEYFESTHGQKMNKIDIDSMQMLCCREITELEDDLVFVTIEECVSSDEEDEILYTMSLTEKKSSGKTHTIKLDKESYVAMSCYCRR